MWGEDGVGVGEFRLVWYVQTFLAAVGVGMSYMDVGMYANRAN